MIVVTPSTLGSFVVLADGVVRTVMDLILIQEFRRKSGTNEIAADFFEWVKSSPGLY
jgi:hypothetical protein